jgi:ABC-type multidrug transport system ATPase subunit
LLLDEPTAGVDPKARRDFWSEIHELAADGLTVLVSTHYMDEAERCHEIAYIAFGEVLARGTVEDVILNSQLTTFTVASADSESLARLSGELSGSPGSEWWRRSAIACMSPAATPRRWKQLSRRIAIAPAWFGSAPLHRSKTCSSI